MKCEEGIFWKPNGPEVRRWCFLWLVSWAEYVEEYTELPVYLWTLIIIQRESTIKKPLSIKSLLQRHIFYSIVSDVSYFFVLLLVFFRMTSTFNTWLFSHFVLFDCSTAEVHWSKIISHLNVRRILIYLSVIGLKRNACRLLSNQTLLWFTVLRCWT